MTFKTAGSPISVLREQLLVNGASFGTNLSDFFPELSRIDKMPARLSHSRDATTYPSGSQPVEDSWEARLMGYANGGPNYNRTTADIRGGQQT